MRSSRDEAIAGIERLLGVEFHDRSLAEAALGLVPEADSQNTDAAFSHEHLVVLGGAVMDVVVAAELCRLHPDWPVGQLTVVAARALSRGSLARIANQNGIADIVRTGYSDGGEALGSAGSLDTVVQTLVGALFLDKRQGTPPHHSDDEANLFFERLAGHAVQMLARHRAPSPNLRDDRGASASVAADAEARAPAPEGLLEFLQLRFGLRFRNRALWEHALLHKRDGEEGCCPELPSPEHIRFIGRAAFRAHVTVLAMLAHQVRRPDRLDKLRAKVAMGATRGIIAKQLGLAEPPKKRKGEADAERHWGDVKAAEVLERIVGALFLDVSDPERSNLVTYGPVLRLLDPVVQAEVEEPPANSKTPLEVLCRTRLNTQPVYKVLEESGPAHEKAFVVSVSIAGVALGLGRGRTKEAAEQRAAEQALQKALQTAGSQGPSGHS